MIITNLYVPLQETKAIRLMKQFTTQIYKVNDDAVFLLSLDVLKLFHENARKRMEDYHKQASETTERAYKIIAIYATLLTLLCAYIFTHPSISSQMLPVYLLFVGTAVSTILMLMVIHPRNYMPLGSTVKDAQPNEYAADFTTDGESVGDDIQMRLILRDELNLLEYSIRWQEQVNIRRVRLFGWSLRFILYGILAALISYFILIFLW